MLYEDCISRSLVTDSPLPIWYLLKSGDEIIGCAGLITNDFISCMDLWPWLAELYIEEEHRGNDHAGLLIERIKKTQRGRVLKSCIWRQTTSVIMKNLVLSIRATASHPWGEVSRVYECEVNSQIASNQ